MPDRLSDNEDLFTFETGPDGAVPTGNEKVCAFTARLLAWIERETLGAVDYAESVGFMCLPQGRSNLVDYCMILETRSAIEKLSATVSHSLS